MSAHSGIAGCVRSVSAGIVTVSRIHPKTGCVSEGAIDASESLCESSRMKVRHSRFRSTWADLYPAASQAWVMTLFDGLLLHQGRNFRAEGGRRDPITVSISSKVIGISLTPIDLRWDFRGEYFDILSSSLIHRNMLTMH